MYFAIIEIMCSRVEKQESKEVSLNRLAKRTHFLKVALIDAHTTHGDSHRLQIIVGFWYDGMLHG
jgi:hypothetical protein